jgi:hypothetical protein
MKPADVQKEFYVMHFMASNFTPVSASVMSAGQTDGLSWLAV